MTIYENTFKKLKEIESQTTDLINSLERAKVPKRDIDKVRLILTKTQSAKAQFNDK